jgi:hypothetical protein
MSALKEEAESQIINESKLRLEVVGKQFEIENAVAQSKKGLAVFVVPTILTPMFIDPEAVTNENGLHTLKKGCGIPDGLVPEEKAKDPLQLATVLARVLSFRAMLEQGIIMIVMLVEPERKKADKKMGFVDKEQVMELVNSYPDQLHFVTISKNDYEDYEDYKDKVCAATYFFYEGHSLQIVGIDATQINAPGASLNWGIRPQEMKKITPLEELLNKYDHRLQDLISGSLKQITPSKL